MAGVPFHVDDADFETKVLGSDIPVVVDFWAEWCGPCKMMAPVFEKLATEYEDKVGFAKVDVDENQQYAAKYGIRGIPTLLVIRGGEEVDRIVGYSPEDEIRTRLDSIVAPTS